MRRIARILLLTPLICPAFAPAQQKNWEFGGSGKWDAVADAPSTQPVSNATLDQVEQLLGANRANDAHDLALQWIKTPGNAAAADRDRALFLLAEAYHRGGDLMTAFYQYDEMLETYPESRFFAPALDRQYAIADEYLNGRHDRFLGMPIINRDDEAIDMLFRVRERSPGSPLAEKALLRTANHYFATSQFDFAGDAYAAYERAYPRSPEMGTVKLRQALSSLAQFHGPKFDATPLIDARAQFEDLKSRYPDLAQQADVQRFLDTINRTLAKKLLEKADWYRRTSRPKASAYTLQTLLEFYGRTPEADDARKALDRLPEWAVSQAKQVRAGASPATGPSSRPTPLRGAPGADIAPATKPAAVE